MEDPKIGPVAVTNAVPAPSPLESEDERVFSADEILGSEDLKPVYTPVPEWGKGGIYLRQLSAFEGGELSDDIGNNGTAKGGNVKILLRCACDKAGNRIFNDAHLAKLKRKNLKVINRLALEALRVNGLLKESAIAELDAAKNG